MIRLGELQKLEVIRKAEMGIYLNDRNEESEESEESVLLPKKQVPEDTKIGDEIEVFIYRDSKDRLIATTKKPKLLLGEIGYLKVVERTKIGAFLNWGLEKDLFLPFKEQTRKVKNNEECLVGIYIDKSDRLCATMDIYKFLKNKSPYNINDKVSGMIYAFKKDIGAFVAVDNKYHGLIPKNELFGVYNNGDIVDCRVTNIREDGRLYLSLREKSYIQMNEDAVYVLNKLKSNGGKLQLNDNSSPKKIKNELDMSKSAFKRAVGRLLKEKQIKITEKGIELLRGK